MFNPNGGPVAKAGWTDVRVLPTAGASPGNADLSNSFASVFPMISATLPDNPNPANDVHWNQNIGTVKDIVPLAWVPTSDDKVRGFDLIPNLYPDLTWEMGVVKSKKILALMVQHFQDKATAGAESIPFGSVTAGPAGPYTPLPNIACTVDEIDASETITKFPDDYVAHWKKQHIDGYITLFGLDALYHDAEENKKMGGLVASLFEHAVIRED
jgi:hypothetical protein